MFLAARLSKDPKTSVVLLEAGGEDSHPLIHVPAGYVKTMVNPAVNWMFETEPESGTANRVLTMPRGKVLGGSSAINAMLYVRGQPADYDSWSQRGNHGWSYDDVLPFFRKAETCEFASAETTTRGASGPLNVANVRNTYFALDKVIEAAKSCGYPHNADYNSGDQDGFGYYQVTQKWPAVLSKESLSATCPQPQEFAGNHKGACYRPNFCRSRRTGQKHHRRAVQLRIR